ncbi:MAG: GNAT family N-acetyltransferase [Beijerinckiaceae bacterium]|nr:GNAT family N-acetyltransferase [Beijerinckiaceae bacterium]
MFPDLTRDDVFRIETRRLWLRWPRAADVADFTRLAGDKAIADMTTCLSHPLHAADAEDFVIGSRKTNVQGHGLVLALSPRDDPAALIGMAGVMFQEEGSRDLILGYWLGRPYWGQGLMNEALEATIDMAFLLSRAESVRSPLRPDNEAGRKVLSRCGFPVGEGTRAPDPAGRKARFMDAAISRSDWLAARSAEPARIACHPSAV